MELVCTGGELAMTDQTTCPHCGAYRDNDRSGIWFDCGSGVVCDHPVNSTLCELKTLRAKVASQQELLDDIRNNLYVQTFDNCPPGYAGIINEGMLRRLGVKLCDT